jgi:hypothetical protein
MPCIYTVVRKVARYETQVCSKAQLVTFVGDVTVMCAGQESDEKSSQTTWGSVK